ncbi:MAG: hypothetical protein ACRD90_06885 [Nitrosopumilaceae archaeon]
MKIKNQILGYFVTVTEAVLMFAAGIPVVFSTTCITTEYGDPFVIGVDLWHKTAWQLYVRKVRLIFEFDHLFILRRRIIFG